MFKTVLIALSTVAAVTLSAGTEANAFGLASAARTIAPKPITVQAKQSDIACTTTTDGCRRTFFLTYEARVRNLFYVKAGSGEAIVDNLRREIAVRSVNGNLFAGALSVKMPSLHLG